MSGPEHLNLISPATLAERLGVSVRTLYFYEAKQLLSGMTVGRAKFYNIEQQRRAARTVSLRRLGFTLKQIQELLRSVDGHQGQEEYRLAVKRQIQVLERRRGEVETALEELREITDEGNDQE
jgi:DNA-binding transcriptional MerR regulator